MWSWQPQAWVSLCAWFTARVSQPSALVPLFHPQPLQPWEPAPLSKAREDLLPSYPNAPSCLGLGLLGLRLQTERPGSPDGLEARGWPTAQPPSPPSLSPWLLSKWIRTFAGRSQQPSGATGGQGWRAVWCLLLCPDSIWAPAAGRLAA